MNLQELLSLPDEAFVRATYDLVLGRPADGGGLAHYLGRLSRGASRASVLVQLMGSAEACARPWIEGAALSDEAFVDALFQSVLRRAPTAGEREGALAQLHSHGNRELLAAATQDTGEARLQAATWRRFEQDVRALVDAEPVPRGWKAWFRRGASLQQQMDAVLCRPDDLLRTRHPEALSLAHGERNAVAPVTLTDPVPRPSPAMHAHIPSVAATGSGLSRQEIVSRIQAELAGSVGKA
jgi:hypothetical protein